jgi:3(or 17)beta-hydroxysteroid dehydrogenase
MFNRPTTADRAAKTDVPLRRLGELMDVAYCVLYLASDEASVVTGTELIIDGSLIAQ